MSKARDTILVKEVNAFTAMELIKLLDSSRFCILGSRANTPDPMLVSWFDCRLMVLMLVILANALGCMSVMALKLSRIEVSLVSASKVPGARYVSELLLSTSLVNLVTLLKSVGILGNAVKLLLFRFNVVNAVRRSGKPSGPIRRVGIPPR